MENKFTSSAREWIKNEYYRKVGINPNYSLRAFARHLRLSPGELSELLRGNRTLTLKSGLKIAQALGMGPAESREFLSLIQNESLDQKHQSHFKAHFKGEPAELAKRELNLEMFQVISEWYCLAILNLAEVADFKFDSQWIARRLGITVAQAKMGLDRLEAVGLIERVKNKLQVTPDFVMSPDGIPSEAIRKYHKSMLKKAEEALEFQAVADRDVSGLQFAVHPRNIPSIKKEIADFQKRIFTKYSKQDRLKKTEVYHLEMALFRVTQKDESQ